MAKIGAALLLGRVRIAPTECCIDNNLLALIPRQANTRFIYYALQTVDLELLVNPGAVPSLSERHFRAVALANPGGPAQRVIADFLDQETAKIDALIDKQTAMIALLRERRQTLIFNTVTGKNSGLRLAETGIRWVGQVPEHWEHGHLRRFAEMRTGHTPSRQHPEYWIDTTIDWFTLADVWQLRPGRQRELGETKERISDVGLANSAAELLPAGTVVLSRTASIGFAGIMPHPMATSQDFWNWVCADRIRPGFLLWTFRAMSSEFAALRMGSTHQTIYQGDAAGFQVAIPPLNEQDEIDRRLSDETSKIDGAIDKVERFIEVARERRAALITAAVTGQIDVREM